MCTVASWPTISVGLTLKEARRIGDLNIDLGEIEIIKWCRKVRDAVRDYDTTKAYQDQVAQTWLADGDTKSGGNRATPISLQATRLTGERR